MAILDFPPNPVVDDIYIADAGVRYIYNGYAWEVDTQSDASRLDALEARCTALEARCTALEAELAAVNWPYLA
jgi:hypothetical protein